MSKKYDDTVLLWIWAIGTVVFIGLGSMVAALVVLRVLS
jgi:hypothetical protein